MTTAELDEMMETYRSILARVDRDFKLDKKIICPACRDNVRVVAAALQRIVDRDEKGKPVR